MVVFDTKTQMWEHAMIKPEMETALGIRDCYRSYVYEPKESKWKTDYMLNSIVGWMHVWLMMYCTTMIGGSGS
ncbi:unnamed protein product [Brassica oleracea]